MSRLANSERNARIVELREKGLWPTEIADEMKLSRNAVLGVLNRAGLCRRDTDKREIQRRRVARGEANGASKLTQKAVADIRENYRPHCSENGGLALARKYGVHIHTIMMVVAGRTWRA